MANAQAIVTKALEDLKSSITHEDQRTFEDASLEALWRDAREIERDQGSRLALQHMGRIEPFLRTLESYSSVVDSMCQGFSPMAWVWVELTNLKLPTSKGVQLIWHVGANQVDANGTTTFSSISTRSLISEIASKATCDRDGQDTPSF